jgi:hypothetical protein
VAGKTHTQIRLEQSDPSVLGYGARNDEGSRVQLPQGQILFRAQRGIEYDVVTDEDSDQVREAHGFGAERMKPLVDRATEGRVNPAGIPVLYLTSTEQTAISEVRPWIGSEISVAEFKIVRDLRTLDLSRGHGVMPFEHLTFAQFEGEEAIEAEAKEKAVWIEIDNAFSRPVTLSDNSADYVPTQILAELLRDAGYEAVIYRSQFGEEGYNVTLFDVDDGALISCAPYRVTRIEVNSEQIGNKWFLQKAHHEQDKRDEIKKTSD